MVPVQYSENALTIVAGFAAQPHKNGNYWNEDAVSPVRKEIKDHYIEVQNRHCAYCNQSIPTNNNAVWDAEHIISKTRRPEFMFEPRNLAISCKDCNIAKGENEVLTNPTRKTFPAQSQDYIIAHPHFDAYGEHICWAYPVCFARSEKGERTIAMCRLTRFSALVIGADGILQGDGVYELVGKLFTVKTAEDARAALAGLDSYLPPRAAP